MDSSRGEKREVNPPTVYRPGAVYFATIHNPVVGCIYSSESVENHINIQLQHQAEYCETDGRTESKLLLKVKFLINKIAPSWCVCFYGNFWQFRNFVLPV